MIKLRTPVTFEDKLAGLNDIFPVTLIDEVKAGISLPVLDSEPVGSISPAKGKFAGCDEHSNLLRRNNCSYKNYEYLELSWTETPQNFTFAFSQTIHLIKAFYTYEGYHTVVEFTNSDFTKAWEGLIKDIWVEVKVACRNMYVLVKSAPFNSGHIKMYGFY